MSQSFEISVVSDEFVKLGYRAEATIVVEPERGRYYVYIWPAYDTKQREVVWEPAEPERQRLGVEFAINDPKGVVLQAIMIEEGRMEELSNYLRYIEDE